MIRNRLLAVAFGITLATSSYAGLLDDINSVLGGVNKVLGAVNGNSSVATTTQGNKGTLPMATATESQLNHIVDALQVDTNNPSLNLAISEAKENISHLLLVGSCQTYGKLLVGPILSPDAYVLSMDPAMYLTDYHPESQCMTVQNIGSWNMPAKNALEFVVVYVSDVSGEAQRRRVEMVKENGKWLVKNHAIEY